MDPTHFLAAPRAEGEQSHEAQRIDAFYDAHGHDGFAALYRVRRWLRAPRERRDAGRAHQHFVPTPAR